MDGQSRIHTGANIATLAFDQADVAHLVSARDFPDALAASYAGGAVHGPVLPVPGDRIGADSPTLQALEDLGVGRAVLVGGEGVLSPSVEHELRRHGYRTDRIAGPDRYHTAAAVARAYGRGGATIGTLDGDRTALLATGETFPDALAAGPVAVDRHFPLLLTHRLHNNPATDDALAQLDIDRIVVVGGPGAVSDAVVQAYQGQGYAVERWHGANRTETAAVIAENARTRLGFDPGLALLARGDDFPDALAAAVHGGTHASPILLTASPDALGAATTQWFRDRCPDVRVVRALGGTDAVSNGALVDAVDSAEWCQRRPHREQSYIHAPQERLQGPPSGPVQITVMGFDAPAAIQPVTIALLPCRVAHPTDPDHQTFQDQQGNGYADGIGTTDTNQAMISSVHGDRVSTTLVPHVFPDADDRVGYTLRGDATDCAVPVAFHDGNDNQQLDVDDRGRPLEPWSYGEIAWAG